MGANTAKGSGTLSDTAGTPVDALTLTAKHPGTLGNTIQYQVGDNTIDNTKTDITLTFTSGSDFSYGVESVKVTSSVNHGVSGFIKNMVDTINTNPVMSRYVVASEVSGHNNDLGDVVTATALSGGSNGDTLTSGDYTGALSKFDSELLEYFFIDSGSTTVLTLVDTWIEQQRTRGKKITWVTGSLASTTIAEAITAAKSYDSEGVIYVYPGATMDGVAHSGRIAAARVAGVLAGLSLNQSITYSGLGAGVTDLSKRLSDSEVKQLLGNGVLPLVWDGVRVRVERGINTFTSYSATKNRTFSKIQTMRILDNINNVLTFSLADIVVGKILNDAQGRSTVLSMVSNFLTQQVSARRINPGFSVSIDEFTADSIFVTVGLQPIDSIEYLYLSLIHI